LDGDFTNGALHLAVRVLDPKPREIPEHRAGYNSIADLINEARAEEFTIERFRTCVLLLDSIYKVEDRSPMPLPSGDFFEVYLDLET
jgi:hypothetical protein